MNNYYIDCLIKERRRQEAEECRRAQLLKAAKPNRSYWYESFPCLVEKVRCLGNIMMRNNSARKGYLS